jgi:phosphoribosylformylglycinamidine synthase
MGAAGLTSSSVEMAGKGGLGITLDLDKVPQRETNMSAYEMMLSESQERMLAILKPGREEDGYRIFKKWGLDAAVIGETNTSGHIVLKHKGEIVCDLPLAPLSDDAPLYDRPWVEPAQEPELTEADVPVHDLNDALIKIISSPDEASKRWLWEQYDRHVMADTLSDSSTGHDAGMVRVHGTRKALAVTSDCTPRYVQANPYEGGKQAVAEAWRNLTAVGAEPIAITDNLNFGSPEKPETMGQIVRAIDGMAEACRALDFPVVSGNVSLYNETNGVSIPPTPTVGAVGLLKDYDQRVGFNKVQAGQVIILIGETRGEMGSSLYLREVFGLEKGAPPKVDLACEKNNGTLVRRLIRSGVAKGVHDLSDGGLLSAAVDVVLASKIGMSLKNPTDLADHVFGFAEDQARYLVAVDEASAHLVIAQAAEADVPAAVIGVAGGIDLSFTGLSLSIEALGKAHEDWLPNYMAGKA